MDFLVQIRREGGLLLHRGVEKNPTDVPWPHFEQITSFWDPEDITSLDKDCWLIPKRWYQGGYDAVRVKVEPMRIQATFVQVTRAQTHSFKSRFMNQMTNQLESLRGERDLVVEFFFVVPTTEMSAFRLPAYADTKWAKKISFLGFDPT